MCVLGVGLNFLMPSHAFEIVLNVAPLARVEPLVTERLAKRDIAVTVYDHGD